VVFSLAVEEVNERQVAKDAKERAPTEAESRVRAAKGMFGLDASAVSAVYSLTS
jgi:hypothetical protein